MRCLSQLHEARRRRATRTLPLVGAQGIEKRHKVAPETPQHRLAAVISETDMNPFLVQDAIEDVVDRLGGLGGVLGITDDAGFIQLHDVGFDQFELVAEDGGNFHPQVRDILVKAVGENSGEHVRAGAGELEGQFRERADEFIIAEQIQSSFADLLHHHPGGQQAGSRSAVGAEVLKIGTEKCLRMPSICDTK